MNKLWIHDGPHVERVNGNGAGGFTGGGRKLVLHTTEGGQTADSIVGTLRSKNAWVHFIIDVHHKKIIQCLPLNVAARGLMHSRGPETNRANCIQIEIVGFAYLSTCLHYGYPRKYAIQEWGPEEYDYLASLCARIHKRFKFPVKVRSFQKPRRFTGSQFVNFAGICGHMHVPGNDHGDPGTEFRGGMLRNRIKKEL